MKEKIAGTIDRVKNALNQPLKLKPWHVLFAVLICVGFMADACQSQTSASQNSASTACDMWGCSAPITNYYEYHQYQQIMQERDNPDLLLNVYIYSEMTGQLTCFGKSYGYGVPYSTQMSPSDVSESNGLYPSQNTSADWVNRSHDTKKSDTIKPEFVEPQLIITPNDYPCTPMTGTGHD